MLSRKGEILLFIKEKPRTTKELRIKFGNGGHVWTNLAQLENDGLVTRPSRGNWKALKVMVS